MLEYSRDFLAEIVMSMPKDEGYLEPLPVYAKS